MTRVSQAGRYEVPTLNNSTLLNPFYQQDVDEDDSEWVTLEGDISDDLEVSNTEYIS